MQKRLLIVGIVLFCLIAPSFRVYQAKAAGVIYYVDSSITDTNVASATPDCTNYDPVAFTCGGGSASAYKTIADINAGSFLPDDQILFRKGQTWRESLVVPSAGTSGHPITFGSYGSGAAPIISAVALDDGTGWTQTHTDVASTGYLANTLSVLNLGNTDGQMREAQSFTIPSGASVSRIDVWGYRRTLGTTDNLTVDLYTSSSSKPSGLLGTSLSIPASIITTSTSGQLLSFAFTAPVALSASTTYWTVIRRSVETINAVNYFSFNGTTNSGFAGGAADKWTQSTATWGTQIATTDLYFQIYTQGATKPIWVKTVATNPEYVVVDSVIANHHSQQTELLTDTDWLWDSTNSLLYLYTNSAPSSRIIDLSSRNYAIDAHNLSHGIINGISPRYSQVLDVYRGPLTGPALDLTVSSLTLVPGARVDVGRVFACSAIDSSGNIYAYDVNTNAIIKSPDAVNGQAWTTLKSFTGLFSCQGMFISSSGNIFMSLSSNTSIGADQGIWRSTDSGTTWTNVDSLAEYGATTATIWGWAEDNEGRIFAGMYSQLTENAQNILRSVDGGATFQGVYNNPTGRHIHDIRVDSATDFIYASQGDNIAPWFTHGILRSTDHGTTWTNILDSTIPDQTLGILVTPTSRLFATDSGGVAKIYRTTDDLTATVVLDVSPYQLYGYWMRRNPVSGYIYASMTSSEQTTNIARIYQSKDDGLTWMPLLDLTATQPYDGSLLANQQIVGNKLFMQVTNSGLQNGIILGLDTPTTTPAISSITSSTTASTATITWNTGTAADSQVAYGLTSTYGSSSALNVTAVTAHSVLFSGLSPLTLYHFQVKSSNGLLATSSDQTLTTIGPPTVSLTSPSSSTTVFGIFPVTATASSSNNTIASVQFSLDGSALGPPITTTSSPNTYSYAWNTASSTDGIHTLSVLATDSFGNTATSSSVSVTINNAFPVLSGGSPTGVLAIGTVQATLSLVTDESSTCKYGPTPGIPYASIPTTFTITGGKVHSSLITGLTSGSYVYYVRCVDAFGNQDVTDFPVSFSITPATLGSTVIIPPPTAVGVGSGGGGGGPIAIVTILPPPVTTPAASSTLELQTLVTTLTIQLQMLQAQASSQTVTTITASGSTPSPSLFTRDLHIGSTGDDVLILQQYLNAKGFVVSSSGPGSSGSETTYFGAKTLQALINFQTSAGITPAAGYFGPVTRGYVGRHG